MFVKVLDATNFQFLHITPVKPPNLPFPDFFLHNNVINFFIEKDFVIFEKR